MKKLVEKCEFQKVLDHFAFYVREISCLSLEQLKAKSLQVVGFVYEAVVIVFLVLDKILNNLDFTIFWIQLGDFNASKEIVQISFKNKFATSKHSRVSNQISPMKFSSFTLYYNFRIKAIRFLLQSISHKMQTQ